MNPRGELKAKQCNSCCVLYLLLFSILVAIFVYPDFKFDSISINKNSAEIDSNMAQYLNKSAESSITQIRVPKLISIGASFTGTSTLEQLIVQIPDIECCSSSFDDNEQLNMEYDYSSNMLNDSIFIDNDYIPNIHYRDFELNDMDLTLSQFRFNVFGILEHIPMDKYIASYCDVDDENENDIFIRNVKYFENPITSTIFGYFSLHFDTKIIFIVREPIDRWYFVDMIQSDKQSFGDYVIHQSFTKKIISMFNDSSISNDDIISVYYKWYFNLRKDVDFELINCLYCVHLMFWIKQFDDILLNNNKKTSNYFKIMQTEYLFDDMIKATETIYCWMTEKCDDEIKRKVINNVKVEHLMSINNFNQTIKTKQTKTKLFRGCNERADKMVEQRPDLVLGEWISWNQLYDKFDRYVSE